MIKDPPNRTQVQPHPLVQCRTPSEQAELVGAGFKALPIAIATVLTTPTTAAADPALQSNMGMDHLQLPQPPVRVLVRLLHLHTRVPTDSIN